jgi:hypothetical protein
LGQVIGFNFKSAGFANVEDMVHRMVLSERHQFIGMFNFIETNDIGKYLRNGRWTEFAIYYNGKDADAQGDPHKLENANKVFIEISPPDINVRIAQLALTFLGFKPGDVDGVFGKNTQNAMQQFEQALGLPMSFDLAVTCFEKLVEKAFGGEIDS